jgi:hypothetical protein
MAAHATPTPDLRELIDDIHRQLSYPIVTPPALLTEREVAQVLHQDYRTLQNWRHAGGKVGLRWVKVGGRAMYRARDLAAYISGCTRETPA